MTKRLGLWFLKLIGVVLFAIIVANIDQDALFTELETANLPLLLASFPLIFATYYCKTKRFQALTDATGLKLPLQKHWEIFNSGIFMASITPGKIGEFGKAAYLKTAGLQAALAIAITVADRIIDVLFISVLSSAGAGLLFGWQWSVVGGVLICIGLSIALFVRKTSTFLRTHITPQTVAPVTLWTLAAWAIYFTWAILLARSIGMYTSVPVMVSVLTFAGILALLPIAPSGLGTRDATLVFLLAPYGVAAEQAVALALLMFISIILSGFLGGWYFLWGK